MLFDVSKSIREKVILISTSRSFFSSLLFVGVAFISIGSQVSFHYALLSVLPQKVHIASGVLRYEYCTNTEMLAIITMNNFSLSLFFVWQVGNKRIKPSIKYASAPCRQILCLLNDMIYETWYFALIKQKKFSSWFFLQFCLVNCCEYINYLILF